MRATYWSVVCATMALGAVPVWAGADPFVRGIDPVPFKLRAGPTGFISLEGVSMGPGGTYGAGLWIDYASGLIALKRGGTKTGNLLKRRLALHATVSYAVTRWIGFSSALPVIIQKTHGFRKLGQSRPSDTSLGDVRLLGHVAIPWLLDFPVQMGVVGEVRAPTGDRMSFTGERGWVLAPRWVVHASLGGWLRLGGEIGYRYRSKDARFLNLEVGDEMHGGVGAALVLPSIGLWERWVASAEVVTSTPASSPFRTFNTEARKTPAELLAALEINVFRGFSVVLGGSRGLGLESGYGRPGFRAWLGVRYTPVHSDRDGDGIYDSRDECPDTPGPERYQGCPDTDEDTIPDIEDKCPDEPGPATNDGCPVEDPLAVLEEEQIVLRGAINFAHDRATILPTSKRVVQAVARILQAHPEIKRVRIDGHTDNRGGSQYNMQLSQRRADAVLAELVALGIEAKRLSAKGHGESTPIASNATHKGRAKNRRVEFIMLELEKGEPQDADDNGPRVEPEPSVDASFEQAPER